MNRRRILLGAAMIAALVGCDGNDGDRLKRVGRKVSEKIRVAADEAKLPKITIEAAAPATPPPKDGKPAPTAGQPKK
jgi:hypothetical protein